MIKLTDHRSIGQIVQRRIVQEIEFADRHQDHTATDVDRFIDKIVELSEFKVRRACIGPILPGRIVASAFKLNFCGELDAIGNVGIEKGNHSLLIEGIPAEVVERGSGQRSRT